MRGYSSATACQCRCSIDVGVLIEAVHPNQVKVETKPWKIALPSRNIEVELTTVSSNYHVEMNPSDVGNQDRYVVQEVIKVKCICSYTSECNALTLCIFI